MDPIRGRGDLIDGSFVVGSPSDGVLLKFLISGFCTVAVLLIPVEGGVLVVRRVKGALLIGIIATTVLAIIVEAIAERDLGGAAAAMRLHLQQVGRRLIPVREAAE